MKRRIGVAHVQQQQASKQHMSELGARMTATHVGLIADQLEALEQQLRVLAEKHRDDIRNDPVVRARFRQLADSLGVDLISSTKNVFAGALGLGDFYYMLASKVVEVCMKERKFCGSYVPLNRVLQSVKRMYSASSTGQKKKTDISVEDILTSLKKLRNLGDGYCVVELCGVKYIQTIPDAVGGNDQVLLLNFILGRQQQQVQVIHAAASAPAASAVLSEHSPQPTSSRRRIGAAYALNAHPLAKTLSEENVNIPFSSQCVFLTDEQVAEALRWEPSRAHNALQRMVQEGSAWVDYPEEESHRQERSIKSSGLREVWRNARQRESQTQRKPVYWFVSMTALSGD